MKTRGTLVAGSMLLVGFAALYRHVAISLVNAWATDGNYSHGFLVVPTALYFAWQRRRRFEATPAQPSASGLLIVLASIATLAAGVLGSELFLTRISMVGALVGSIVFLTGWPRVRAMTFPLALLLLMIPVPAIVFNQVAFPLQLLASRVGEMVLSGLTIPVLREGNVLVLAHANLEVAEACAGIRSLVSLIFVGAVFGYGSDTRLWARSAIVLAAIPIAIVTNGLRVAGTGIAAHLFGPDVADGFVHTFSGWLVFMVACTLVVAFARVLRRVAPPC